MSYANKYKKYVDKLNSLLQIGGVVNEDHHYIWLDCYKIPQTAQHLCSIAVLKSIRNIQYEDYIDIPDIGISGPALSDFIRTMPHIFTYSNYILHAGRMPTIREITNYIQNSYYIIVLIKNIDNDHAHYQLIYGVSKDHLEILFFDPAPHDLNGPIRYPEDFPIYERSVWYESIIVKAI